MDRETFNVTNPVVLYNSTKQFSLTTNTTLLILITISHINKVTHFNKSWSLPGHPESHKSGNMTMRKTYVK